METGTNRFIPTRIKSSECKRAFALLRITAGMFLLTSKSAFSQAVIDPATQPNLQLSSQQIVWLSLLATAGLVAMWGFFWWKIPSNVSVAEILQSAGFFRTVAVMGVIAATVVLSLAGRLEGPITGAILSGIVGYVLGHLANRGREHRGDIDS
jgi:hypothetical protein